MIRRVFIIDFFKRLNNSVFGQKNNRNFLLNENYLHVFIRLIYPQHIVIPKSLNKIDDSNLVMIFLINGLCKKVAFIKDQRNLKKIKNNCSLILTDNPKFKLKGKKKVFWVIRNHDGSIRWVIKKKSDFKKVINTYSTSNMKILLLKIISSVPFCLNLLSHQYYVYIDNDDFTNSYKIDWDVVYAGVIGPHQKLVIYSENKDLQYTKLPIGNLAKKFIAHEKYVLRYISKNEELLNYIPKIANYKDGLKVELCEGLRNSKIKFDARHLKFLKLLNNIPRTVSGKDLYVLARSYHMRSTLSFHSNLHHQFYATGKLASGINVGLIDVTFAHGDFTPWNITINKSSIKVFDWEMSQFDAPLFFDFFHYVYSVGILVERKNFQEIFEDTLSLKKVFYSEIEIKDFFKYQFLYLYIQSYIYLSMLENYKGKPIQQACWQLSVWSEGLKSLLAKNFV